MGFFDKLTKGKGGYIFLSHSHADIDKVREIRNSLEQEGFEPLCFYLKCLSDDSEIEDLIKREIDAREWFLFVDSDNSRKSKWVTMEREYIKRTNSKKIVELNLENNDSIVYAVSKIVHSLRIYMSYSKNDIELARRIKHQLEEKDYLVYLAQDDVNLGIDYATTIYNAISEASQEGGVLVLITKDVLKSSSILREIDFALSRGGNIIPVLVGDVQLDSAFTFFLARHQMIRISQEPTDQEIEVLVDKIGRNIVNNI